MKFKEKSSINGNKLFDIDSPKNPGKKFSYEYPFDLSFNIKNDVEKDHFKGPAIYVIEFKDEVIYIGKYRPEDRSLISTRWVKHIMTFTNRGYRVGGSALKKLVLAENDFAIFKQNKKFFEDIYRYFESEENENRYEDTNTLTSFNRLRFADKYSKFNSHKVDISDFTFNCFTLSGDEKNLSKRKELISIIEKILLIKYQPKCNKEYLRGESKIKLTDVKSDLEKSLDNLLKLCNK